MVNQRKKKIEKGIQSRPTEKIESFDESYYDFKEMKNVPVRESFIQKMAQELYEWSYKPDAGKIYQFVRLKGINQASYDRWVEKYQFFKEAHEEALLAIGNTMEMGCRDGSIDRAMVAPIMNYYAPEWRKAELWRSRLKFEEIGDRVINVIIPPITMEPDERFPTADIVPERMNQL